MSDPITPLRLSDINLDRLNKTLVQLNQQLRGLDDRIKALEAKVSAATAGKPGYPGIANGSAAIIQGPVPGGPSPLEPWLKHHSMLVGEGSAPVRQITGSDGQVPIAATGADPIFQNITGSSFLPTLLSFGISITNGSNSINLSLSSEVQAWLILVSAILGISAPSG